MRDFSTALGGERSSTARGKRRRSPKMNVIVAIKKLRIYLDTSVINFLLAVTRKRQRHVSNRKPNNRYSEEYLWVMGKARVETRPLGVPK
jgi:hypothetical protein